MLEQDLFKRPLGKKLFRFITLIRLGRFQSYSVRMLGKGVQLVWKSHIKHNCKLDDVRAGFKLAKAYWIGHGLDAKPPIDVRQGGLF